MNLTIRRTAALGDVLCATIIAQALSNPCRQITFQAHRDFHEILRRVKCITKIEEPSGPPNINLDGAYEKHPMRQIVHLYDLMFAAAQKQFPSIEWQPKLRPRLERNPKGEQIIYSTQLEKLVSPWIMVCPRSEYYVMRQVPDAIWSDVAAELNWGTMFWLGQHPSPYGFVDLQVRNIPMLIDTIACADLLVTVDTGPMHIAAALDVPIVAIFQSVNPSYRLPSGCGAEIVGREDLTCLNCQKTLCPINATQPPCQQVPAESIAGAIKRRLAR